MQIEKNINAIIEQLEQLKKTVNAPTEQHESVADLVANMYAERDERNKVAGKLAISIKDMIAAARREFAADADAMRKLANENARNCNIGVRVDKLREIGKLGFWQLKSGRKYYFDWTPGSYHNGYSYSSFVLKLDRTGKMGLQTPDLEEYLDYYNVEVYVEDILEVLEDLFTRKSELHAQLHDRLAPILLPRIQEGRERAKTIERVTKVNSTRENSIWSLARK